MTPRRKALITDGVEYYLCRKCGKLKRCTDFYNDRSRPAGIASNCIVCEKQEYTVPTRREGHRQSNKKWIHNRKKEFFKGNKCVHCSSGINLMVRSVQAKVRIENIYPWNHPNSKGWEFICRKCYMDKFSGAGYKQIGFALLPEFWPFIQPEVMQIADTADGYDLLVEVNKAVAKGISDDAREDICQDILLAILEGEMEIDDLRKPERVNQRIKKTFAYLFNDKNTISLDEADGDDRSMHERISI
jgi:hypothetical protein